MLVIMIILDIGVVFVFVVVIIDFTVSIVGVSLSNAIMKNTIGIAVTSIVIAMTPSHRLCHCRHRVHRGFLRVRPQRAASTSELHRVKLAKPTI